VHRISVSPWVDCDRDEPREPRESRASIDMPAVPRRADVAIAALD
jgi:hypothetical protein